MDWDDLRYILAVARTGSLSGAARKLGVNHSTVHRRIAAAEDRLGVRLFDKLPNGYVATAFGEEVRLAAETIDERVIALDRKISGKDLLLEGTVRVTTPDSFAHGFLLDHLAAFRRAYPGITIELSVSNTFLNLTHREADVALRPTNSPPETAVGRRLATVAFACYASNALLIRHGVLPEPRGTPPRDIPWVVPDDSLAHVAAARWPLQITEQEPAMRADSLLSMTKMAEVGVGQALLPCHLGDASSRLTRVSGNVNEVSVGLWLLTHEDLRHNARVRAFLDFIALALERDKPLIEGTAPSNGTRKIDTRARDPVAAK